MNLASLLVENAWRHPERAALVDRHRGRWRSVSYGEFARRVAAGAAELGERGMKRGQVILVFQPVSIELYEILLAAFHAGLRVMLADPSAGREFLSLCCRRLPPDAFFGSWKAQCLRLAVAEMRAIPLSLGADGFPAAKRWRTDSGGIPPVKVDPEEAALVTFTSGSTGVPKAVVRSHRFLLDQHAALARALDFREGEVDLITLPVFVLANLASGLTSVLAATDLAKPGLPDARALAAQCEAFRVTRCAASPAFFEGLLASAGGMPAFEKVFTGGAPVFPDLLRRLQSALPEAQVDAVFGSTEAEPIAHFSARDADGETDGSTRRGGGLCAGIPVPEIRVRVIGNRWGQAVGPMNEENFAALQVPPGEAGEIVVMGPHVLRGYLDGVGDEETKIHVEGAVWHRTGDAGWFDEKQRLWLLGRCAERLAPVRAPAGLPTEALAYPFTIECALREIFPTVRMAALEWQGLRTLVVGKSCSAGEMAAIRAEARVFGMERVIGMESLPMDRRHNAKIDYPALRERLGAASSFPPEPE